jgi:calcium permeable stress-gated cation channel
MDAYFFVRYLRMMIKLFGPIWLISWITLLPLTGITGTTGKTGLDRFTFGNIGASDDGRYWGLLVVAWVFTGE